MVLMNFIFNSINLAAEEKTKRKKHNRNPVLYWHESEGNTKIKLIFNFQKIGLGGSVKRKIKNSGLIKAIGCVIGVIELLC